MDSTVFPEILRQGPMGIVGGILLWLFIAERNDHKQTRKEKDALMEARRMDAKETEEKFGATLASIAQSTGFIADKLVSTKRRK
jgi:hypothetical protein